MIELFSKLFYIVFLLMVGCTNMATSKEGIKHLNNEPPIIENQKMVAIFPTEAWKRVYEAISNHELFTIIDSNPELGILTTSFKTPEPCEYSDCGTVHIINQVTKEDKILQNCGSSENLFIKDIEPKELNQISVNINKYNTELTGIMVIQIIPVTGGSIILVTIDYTLVINLTFESTIYEKLKDKTLKIISQNVSVNVGNCNFSTGEPRNCKNLGSDTLCFSNGLLERSILDLF